MKAMMMTMQGDWCRPTGGLTALLLGALLLGLGCGDDSGSDSAGGTPGDAVPPGGAGSAAPATPGTPDAPGTPATPGTPDAPATPGTPTPPAVAADYSYSACTVADHVGGFSIGLVTPGGAEPGSPSADPYTVLRGLVTDGIIPTNVPVDVMSSGECKLVMGRNLFCDPECDFDETCGEDGVCRPQPVGQDMGTVDIQGLVDGPVSMEPRAPKFNYTNTGTLSYPGFTEGAAITLTGAGNIGPALALQAEGVAPLVINESEVVLVAGSAATMTWNAPATAGRSHVLATLNISLHGGDPVRIECDAEDDGSLEIPAELVTELLTFDYSGFPAITVVRQTSEATEGPDGCIDFRIFASRERYPVSIDGLTSCNENRTTCPAGQACNLQLMLCE